MTIAFSPFLTADVDETLSRGAQWASGTAGERNDAHSIRLELIRRRVLAGYYSSPEMASEIARRLVRSSALSEY